MFARMDLHDQERSFYAGTTISLEIYVVIFISKIEILSARTASRDRVKSESIRESKFSSSKEGVKFRTLVCKNPKRSFQTLRDVKKQVVFKGFTTAIAQIFSLLSEYEVSFHWLFSQKRSIFDFSLI